MLTLDDYKIFRKFLKMEIIYTQSWDDANPSESKDITNALLALAARLDETIEHLFPDPEESIVYDSFPSSDSST